MYPPLVDSNIRIKDVDSPDHSEAEGEAEYV